MDTTALSHQMFDQLFRQNKRQLFIVAFSYVRDEDVAQDIVNDSFMSLWERRESIEPTNLKAYLFRVVKNNCLHYRRDQQIGRAVCEKIRQKEAGMMEYYKVLQEKGFFNRLIAGNISQMVKVDSIRCDFDRYPYEVTTYARQRILRESTVTERSLVTTCRLVNTSRSDNNPQGFMVEALNIVENKDIATYDR